MKLYTIEQIQKYILSQDSLGDVLYNLTEENIDKANKMIEIVSCAETIYNDGTEEAYDEQETYRLLINPDEWTDDQRFYSSTGVMYFIDDLIGEKVKVGPIIFTVQDHE
jgi:hypothetical protein